MKILVSDPSYSDFEGDPSQLPVEIDAALGDIGPYELSSTDIGPGADWPVFMVAFGALGSVFLLGEKINKNLDAWAAIGGKLKRGLDRLRQKLGGMRVDEDAAKLLLLSHLRETGVKLREVEVAACHTQPIHQFSGRPERAIDSRYDALYMIVLIVNDEHIVVAGVRSSGEIDFVRKYGAHFMNFATPAT